jgi:hypothetical protein
VIGEKLQPLRLSLPGRSGDRQHGARRIVHERFAGAPKQQPRGGAPSGRPDDEQVDVLRERKQRVSRTTKRDVDVEL